MRSCPTRPREPDAQVDSRADARVRAGVADFAEQGNASRIPKTKLPSDTSYRTDAQVDARADARIATFARANSPSGTIPDARIPASIARDSEIASYARASSPSGTIPDAQIPAAITRDTEVAGRLVPAVTSADNDKIAQVVSGAWALADAPSGGSGGGGGGELIYDKTITVDRGTNVYVLVPTVLDEDDLLLFINVSREDTAQYADWRTANILLAGTAYTGTITITEEGVTRGAGGYLPGFNAILSLNPSSEHTGSTDEVSVGRTSSNQAILQLRSGSNNAPIRVYRFAGGAGSGGGSTSGLDQAAVDARVLALVADFAEQGNTDRIAKTKLPSDTSYRTDAQVDSRADARIATFARANSPSGVVPDAQLPDTAKRTDAQVDSRADARVRAGVADFAEQGDTSRIPKTKLPSDTSYRTDAQVDARADARIATFARANNPSGVVPDARLPDTAKRTDAQVDARIAGFARANSPSGTIPDARIPSAITRDTEVAGRLLPSVTTANNDKIAKVVNGAWALGDDNAGSGGASTPILRKSTLGTAVVATAGTQSWGTWTNLATTTISASEAGFLFLLAHTHATSNAAVGGGDRIWSHFRIVRTRGSMVVAEHQAYGPRNMGNADAATNTLSRDIDDAVTGMDIAQSGDVYTVQARYWAQSATARTLTHATGDTNSIQIGRP